MNAEKKNDIPQAIVDFLGRLLQWLKQILDTLIKGPQRGKPDQDKPGTENASADGQNTWRILWLMLLVLAAFLVQHRQRTAPRRNPLQPCLLYTSPSPRDSA